MFILCLQSAQAKDITFVQATDTHFSKKSPELEKFVEDVNSIPDVDFVMFTGDNIDTSNEDDLKSFLKENIRTKKLLYLSIFQY